VVGALNGEARSAEGHRGAGALDPAGLETHPAVKAWTRLAPGEKPGAVTVLRKPKRSQRSAAYRLEGCGPDGADVIAKRCRRGSAEIEHTIYRELLPGLPIRSLRYHGMIDDGREWCWMFLEDAGGERYSPLVDEHRRLAAHWLATVHGAASQTRESAHLPDRGPGHYLAHLRSARGALSTHARESAPGSEESLVVRTLLRRFDTLESRWSEVTAFCDTLTPTLVHGDFLRKHLRIRSDGNGTALVAFDWEKAGWGVPAADLAQLPAPQRSRAATPRASKRFVGFSADPCLETYLSTLDHSTPGLDAKSVERLGTVGSLFRCLAGLDWLGQRLAPGWTPLAELQVYSAWLAEAMDTVGFDPRSARSLNGSNDSAENALVRYLEREALPRMRGRQTKIARLERTRSPDTTSYPTEIVTAHLANGEAARLFLKDLGSSRAPKDGAEERRAREAHVYRDLLDGSELGVPAYYGSVNDERRGRFWLLLELVPSTQLRSCNFDRWVDAAGWLGWLQGYVAQDAARFESSPLLIRHDREYFARRAELALVEATHMSTPLARRLSGILAGYDRLIDVMVEQPRTLVHGNYRPKNILLDLEAEPLRVCAVDWEVAAIGATMYDLALLSDGYESSRLEALFDAYRTEAIEQGVPMIERRDMGYIADCFRLHRVVKALSRAHEKGFSEGQLSDLLDHGERLHRRLRGRSRVGKR
jgi:aminoglycoside phosphotransferase (APT) family kinase protein